MEKFGSICHFCHFRHTNTLEVQIAVKTEELTAVVKPASYIYLYEGG